MKVCAFTFFSFNNDMIKVVIVMKKILIALLAIVMITGCSTSKKTQTLFVEKNKKYV